MGTRQEGSKCAGKCNRAITSGTADSNTDQVLFSNVAFNKLFWIHGLQCKTQRPNNFSMAVSFPRALSSTTVVTASIGDTSYDDYTTDYTDYNGGDKSKTCYLQLDGERGGLCITIHSNNTWIVFANLGKCRSICHPCGYLYAKTYYTTNFSFRSVLWVNKECLNLKTNKIKIQLMVHHQLLILLCRQAIKNHLPSLLVLSTTFP